MEECTFSNKLLQLASQKLDINTPMKSNYSQALNYILQTKTELEEEDELYDENDVDDQEGEGEGEGEEEETTTPSTSSSHALARWTQPVRRRRRKKYRTTEFAKKRQKIAEQYSDRPSTAIPRILKSDIRRQYPIMAVNVFNSKEFSLLLDFFNHFCSPLGNYSFRRVKYGYPEELIQFQKINENGPISWIESLYLAPDAVMELKNCKFILRSNGTSRIEATAIVTGTVPLFFNSLPKNLFDAFQFIYDKFTLFTTLFMTLRGSSFSSTSSSSSSSSGYSTFQDNLSFLHQFIRNNSESSDEKDICVYITFSIQLSTIAELDMNCYVSSFDICSDWNFELGKNLNIKILPKWKFLN